MKKNEFLEKTLPYFEGVFSFVGDDLPDGAWFQMHVDLAEECMADCCKEFGIKKPKGIDGHDITHYYLNKKSAVKMTNEGGSLFS